MTMKYDALSRLNHKHSMQCLAITPSIYTKIQLSVFIFAQLSISSCRVSDQDSNTNLINSKRELSGLHSDEQKLIMDAHNKHYFRIKNVSPSGTSSSAESTTNLLETLVIYKYFYLDDHFKCRYNHYSCQQANTKALQKGATKTSKNRFLWIATYIGKWVPECETGIQDKRLSNARYGPELI